MPVFAREISLPAPAALPALSGTAPVLPPAAPPASSVSAPDSASAGVTASPPDVATPAPRPPPSALRLRLIEGGRAEADRQFARQLATLRPDLRRAARALTGDADRAEDLVQDTFERAFRARSSFRDGSNLRAWLLRIQRNLFLSERRRRAVEARVLGRAASDPNGWAREAVGVQVHGLPSALESALEGLPPDLARIVCLVDLGDHSYREAAEREGIPIGTVMSRVHRGRLRLRRLLDAPLAGEHCEQAVAGL